MTVRAGTAWDVDPPATLKTIPAFLWKSAPQPNHLWTAELQAFLTAASAQVGQVILTLPHSLALTNIIAGTFLQLLFATWAMYTLYLMGELICKNG